MAEKLLTIVAMPAIMATLAMLAIGIIEQLAKLFDKS
jgi:hypothetical protein